MACFGSRSPYHTACLFHFHDEQADVVVGELDVHHGLDVPEVAGEPDDFLVGRSAGEGHGGGEGGRSAGEGHGGGAEVVVAGSAGLRGREKEGRWQFQWSKETEGSLGAGVVTRYT